MLLPGASRVRDIPSRPRWACIPCLRGELGLAHGPPDTVAKWQRRSTFNHKYLCNRLLSTEASLPRGMVQNRVTLFLYNADFDTTTYFVMTYGNSVKMVIWAEQTLYIGDVRH